jgi:hypothetical protein
MPEDKPPIISEEYYPVVEGKHGPEWTSLKKNLVLQALAKLGNLKKAAEFAGVARSTVFNWQEKDELFKKGVKRAKIAYSEVIEKKIDNQIDKDVTKVPILTIVRLKALHPEAYNEKYQVEHNIPGLNALSAIGACLLSQFKIPPKEIEGQIEDISPAPVGNDVGKEGDDGE